MFYAHEKLTTLLVNADGALVPRDSIDKHMIKKKSMVSLSQLYILSFSESFLIRS